MKFFMRSTAVFCLFLSVSTAWAAQGSARGQEGRPSKRSRVATFRLPIVYKKKQSTGDVCIKLVLGDFDQQVAPPGKKVVRITHEDDNTTTCEPVRLAFDSEPEAYVISPNTDEDRDVPDEQEVVFITPNLVRLTNKLNCFLQEGIPSLHGFGSERGCFVWLWRLQSREKRGLETLITLILNAIYEKGDLPSELGELRFVVSDSGDFDVVSSELGSWKRTLDLEEA